MIFSKSILKRLSPLFLIICAWSFISLFFDSFVLPSPLETFGRVDQFFSSDFFIHLKISGFRITLGALISFLAGSLLGVVAVLFHIKKVTESLYVMGQTVPAIIVAVILLILFGTGNSVPVILIVLMVTPFVAQQTMSVLEKPDPIILMVVKSHGGGRRELIWDVYLPKLVPTMRATATLAITMGVKVCILGEFIGSDNGIGFLINVARLYLNMDEVLFYVTVILFQMFIFQLMIDFFFRCFLEKYFYPD